MIVTNSELEPLDEGVEFIVQTSQEVLDKMNEWCVVQHGKVHQTFSPLPTTTLRSPEPSQTGLTASCLASKTTMAEVDDLVSAYVVGHCPDGMALLAGNSVHADKQFISKVRCDVSLSRLPLPKNNSSFSFWGFHRTFPSWPGIFTTGY